MRMTKAITALAVTAMLTIGGAAQAAQVYTLDGSDGWSPYQMAGSGVLEISTEQPNSSGASLKLASTGTTAKAGALFGSASVGAPALGTLGALIDGGSVGYDFYKSGDNTSAAHFAPTLKLHVISETGARSTLVWEPVYNSLGSAAADTWHSVDVSDGNFWMYKKGPSGAGNINVFNITLEGWANGAAPSGISSPGFFGIGAYNYGLNANAIVTGIEIGIGSGWSGNFTGYVDNVYLNFAGGNSYFADFAVESAVVPTPAAAWAGLVLLGALGLRRRSRMNVA